MWVDPRPRGEGRVAQVADWASSPRQEIDELVDEWTPEPLVAPQTTLEEMEMERGPVLVG